SNNVVGSGSFSGFSDEQFSTLMSLIKENYVNGKGVIIDSGANQHITFTDKFLVNVIDISLLKIKVSHPKGTEAFIIKIGNMPLTEYLTLFDVLVVPEYCVSLMYVHKVARDKIGELVYLDLWGPYKNSDKPSGQFVQDLNHLNFFNSDYLDDHPDIPNNEERINPNPTRYNTLSPHSSSTFKPLHENEGEHSQGPNAVASEDERSANHEDDQNNYVSGGDESLIHPQDDIHQNIQDFSNLRSVELKSFLESSKHQPWVDAMNSEMDALYRNNTWEMADLPKGRKDIGCLINLYVQSGWTLYQMDVNNVFLYGDLNETVYMSLPPGYFHANETRNNFMQSKSDYSLFTKSYGDVLIALLLYVNDIINTGNSLLEINKFKQFLKTKFMIKDFRKLKYFLGIEVLETPSGICLNKRKYFLELINEFGLLDSKPSYIPMQPNISLSSEPKDDDHLLDNITKYQKFIVKLVYLTTTRPNIAYIVSCLSQFMHSPLKSHLKTALKVSRYLKGSPGKGINVIKRYASGIDLKAYTDADWAKCTNTRRIRLKGLDIKQDNLLCSKMELIDMF
ncbi:ribonuclease H-like domain-containing protein, partial [Tanacetum coccineum]